MPNYVALRSLPAGVIQDQAGNAQSGRLVRVYLHGTTTPVTVYPNSDGTGTPLPQPLATDANGNVPGYVQSPQDLDILDVASNLRDQAQAFATEDLAAIPVQTSQLPTPLVTGSPGLPLVTVGGTLLVNVPTFQPATGYPPGFVIQQGGVFYERLTTGTSAATFAADATNWLAVSDAAGAAWLAQQTATGAAVAQKVNTDAVMVQQTFAGGLPAGAAVKGSPRDCSSLDQVYVYRCLFMGTAAATVEIQSSPDMVTWTTEAIVDANQVGSAYVARFETLAVQSYYQATLTGGGSSQAAGARLIDGAELLVAA